MHSYDCEDPQDEGSTDYTSDFVTTVTKPPVKSDLIMVKKRPRRKIVESVQRDPRKSKAKQEY